MIITSCSHPRSPSKHCHFSKMSFFFLADSNAGFSNLKMRRELDTLRRPEKDLQSKCFKAAFPAQMTRSFRSHLLKLEKSF